MKEYIKFFWLVFFMIIINELNAQDVYRLWEGEKIPYYIENNLEEYEKESWGAMCSFDITEPTLTIYKAQGKNSHKAVIIIPGGGYSVVAIHHEGYDLAKVLSENGITAAVLKYRLPNPKSSDQPHKVPIADSRRALKLFRKMVNKYGFDKDKVGVLGFSAGSHLATVTSLWKSEDKNENPNFSALIYGVTDLDSVNLKWLEDDLYYRKLTDDEIKKNTLLNLVSNETPPAFLVHSYDDKTCNVKESTLYAEKLYQHNVPVEMHIFPKGGHGFGMGRKKDGTDQWVRLFINWLKREI